MNYLKWNTYITEKPVRRNSNARSNEGKQHGAGCKDEDRSKISLRICKRHLVGAANVLEREDDTICEANIESIMRILREKNIAVRASALGGTERKSVFMDIEKGCISYTEAEDKEKTLWQVSQLN